MAVMNMTCWLLFIQPIKGFHFRRSARRSPMIPKHKNVVVGETVQ